jgi:hypothetical protein
MVSPKKKLQFHAASYQTTLGKSFQLKLAEKQKPEPSQDEPPKEILNLSPSKGVNY